MLLMLLFTSAAIVSAHHEHPAQYKAIAKLTQPSGDEVHGNVTFTQLADGKVHVQGAIVGLAPGHYGFHVHEKGDISGGCGTTGSHYNPHHKDHGHPNDENRHVGDLGNVVFDENRVSVLDYVDSVICLTGEYSIVGRAVVLHEKADDFGRSDHPDSRKTGNAGGRVACGVIGILDPVEGWQRNSSANSRNSLVLIFTSMVYFFIKHLI
ncbi:PREDICTED: superoxide dismutase [Cu-Zn] 4AP-like isoform X2 [Papilio polytes]|nr:PREDICTED: superoxide dismutase [Cu-Zn] 4AP-like isoform X2 [Papilio polytes]